jgi:SNF2 family DNA or RNA helicase
MFIKLLQISAGSVKQDDGSILHLNIDPKLDDIMEIYEESGHDKQIIVSAFRASVERICSDLKARGMKVEYIHGGVDVNTRAKILHAFQHGDLEGLVVQPQAVAHGITLTSCNTITWQSYITSGEVWIQMNGRITRAGQERKQYVRRQCCSKVEQKLIAMLEGKINLSGAVLKMFETGDL